MDPSLSWDDEGNLSLMSTQAIVVFHPELVSR